MKKINLFIINTEEDGNIQDPFVTTSEAEAKSKLEKELIQSGFRSIAENETLDSYYNEYLFIGEFKNDDVVHFWSVPMRVSSVELDMSVEPE